MGCGLLPGVRMSRAAGVVVITKRLSPLTVFISAVGHLQCHCTALGGFSFPLSSEIRQSLDGPRPQY